MTPRTTPIAILPDPPPSPTPLGLIAASGRLPVIVAEGMAKAGHPVHCLGLVGQYDPELPQLCARFREAGVLRPASWGRLLRKMDVEYAVMVGRVDKASMMHSWTAIIRNRPDWKSLLAWWTMRKDRRSHVVLTAVAEALAKDGVHLIDSTAHIPDHIATEGPMTRRTPTPGQRADIEFGWPILQELLRLDIGQAITVRECDIVAVEAVEGTDRMIERTGELCRSAGWTLLKSARAGHDRRSDVPTIGPQTVKHIHAAGGRCIAVGAGDVIIIDKPETLALADQLGVSVVGLPVV